MAHPGWTELTTVKKTTIEVAGVEVEIDVDIPVTARVLCECCSRVIQWYQTVDPGGEITIWAEKCKCEEA